MPPIDSLFNSFSLKSLSMANRIVMAPMSRYHSPDNIPSEASAAYYQRRAAGGVGLILTEGTCPNHIAANGYENVPYFHGEERLAGWKKVVDQVHAEGGKIAPQLWHCGGIRKRGVMPEGDVDGYTPSGMNVPGKVTRHVMTQQDIDEVVRAYAEGARDAQRLGFDALEIHGAHGYLIDQFFWEGTNQRTDGYGGSMAARGRFAVEVIEACRSEVGPNFPILLRWSQWKQQDFSARLASSPQLLESFLQPLVDAGVDAFHCSQRRFWEPEFEGSDMNLAGWVKKLTGMPTITVGSVSLDQDFISQTSEGDGAESKPASIDRLLEMLDRGDFDLVAVGRALIANPDWPKVVRSGDTLGLRAFSKDQLATLD